jgi:hypothetical protein
MKCWNSAFSAQGLRVIIVVVQVGEKWKYMYPAVEALGKKERGDQNLDETPRFGTKSGAFLSLTPLPPLVEGLMICTFSCRFCFVESHPVLDQTQGTNGRVVLTLWKTLLLFYVVGCNFQSQDFKPSTVTCSGRVSMSTPLAAYKYLVSSVSC